MDSKLTCNSGTVSATTLMTNLAANDVTANNGGWQGITTTFISLKSCLNDIVTNRNKHGVIYSLIMDENVSSDGKTVTLYGGRKFSDYSLLIFLMKYSTGDIRGTAVISTNEFTKTDNGGLYIITRHGASYENTSGLRLVYNSNTKVDVVPVGNKAFTVLYCLGMT